MARTRESLGEDIGLVFSGNVRKSNLLVRKGFMNGMTIYVNMFGVLMKNGIGSNMNSTIIISMKRSKSKFWNTKFA